MSQNSASDVLDYPKSLTRYSPQPPKGPRVLSFRWKVECPVGCLGAGCYSTDGYDEVYCECEAGKWRRVYDGGTTDEHYDET